MRAESASLPARERSDWKRIAEALELDVIVGRLHLRERLVEDEVMKRFDASRYSVRRAFDEMQALGLVVRSENRGVSIRGFTTKEVADLFGLREILESAAALQIPMPVAAEIVDRLAAIQKKHDAATKKGDFYKLFQLNNAFHQTLYSSCGNEALTQAIARYSLQVQPIRMRFVHDEVRRRQTADEHWAMIEAIRSQDNAALARICAKHLSVTKTMFLRSEGEPARAAKTSARASAHAR
ncbi:GntR family transcriptional regulator [Variovorax sp. PBL-E5]|uniref:GntR family transcriptional regulator n=1 Tax=Variovorax sp. PBL-E5 TaxID=434014 RepID=UPI0013161195|nr:GntR family transcriptional regulator [Variovorax sp. PBL-E5]VTU37237.1 transcriptional regulator NanR [Variovorax sp. PBL-E5]